MLLHIEVSVDDAPVVSDIAQYINMALNRLLSDTHFRNGSFVSGTPWVYDIEGAYKEERTVRIVCRY